MRDLKLFKEHLTMALEYGIDKESQIALQMKFGASFAEALAELVMKGKLTIAFDPQEKQLLLRAEEVI